MRALDAHGHVVQLCDPSHGTRWLDSLVKLDLCVPDLCRGAWRRSLPVSLSAARLPNAKKSLPSNGEATPLLTGVVCLDFRQVVLCDTIRPALGGWVIHSPLIGWVQSNVSSYASANRSRMSCAFARIASSEDVEELRAFYSPTAYSRKRSAQAATKAGTANCRRA